MIYDYTLIDSHEAPSRLALQKFHLALRQAQTQLASDMLAISQPMSEEAFRDWYLTSINEALGVVVVDDNEQPTHLTIHLPMWLRHAQEK